MMNSHLMLKRHLFFVSVENSATPFPFQKRCGAWHAPVLWCRDHLMVVLCSDPGIAASEKLHQLPLFAARTIRLNATSPRSPSAHWQHRLLTDILTNIYMLQTLLESMIMQAQCEVFKTNPYLAYVRYLCNFFQLSKVIRLLTKKFKLKSSYGVILLLISFHVAKGL